MSGTYETITEEKENKHIPVLLPKIHENRKAPTKIYKNEISKIVSRLKELKEDQEFKESIYTTLQDEITDKESYSLANHIIEAILNCHSLSPNVFKNFKNQDALKAKCKKMISMLGNYVPHELLDNLKSGFS
jgi:predicted patatin/cPLA2 family phospholipase